MSTSLYVVLGLAGLLAAAARLWAPEPQHLLAGLWSAFGLANLLVAWIRHSRIRP